MTNGIELKVQKEFAEQLYEFDNIEYWTSHDGNMFIRGELVATYEGIIQ